MMNEEIPRSVSGAMTMSAPPLRGKRLFCDIMNEEESSSRTKIEMVSSVPDELLCVCTSYLDAASLLRVRQVSKRFRLLASRNEAGWSRLCALLWQDKVHVRQEFRDMPSAMLAYKTSLLDAQQRQEVTLEELCYDPATHQGTVWSFRFKESAGPDWTHYDPWWNGREARQMVFLKDGRVQTYHANGEAATLVSPHFGNDSGVLTDPPINMTWRFLSHPMDLPTRPKGSYIRFSVGFRDVPTYVVKRYDQNWGFLMESCWGLYTSFDLPPRQVPPPNLRLRRTHDGGRWLNVNESDTDDENTDSTSLTLADDSALTITNEVQWREALLYNFGARTLPEGEGASADFDRNWGRTLNNATR